MRPVRTNILFVITIAQTHTHAHTRCTSVYIYHLPFTFIYKCFSIFFYCLTVYRVFKQSNNFNFDNIKVMISMKISICLHAYEFLFIYLLFFT